jgi:hypothetical protein
VHGRLNAEGAGRFGKREEGRGKREEGKREEGRGKREEGRGKREEGRGKREEGRGKREEGRGKRGLLTALMLTRSARKDFPATQRPMAWEIPR